MPRAARIAFPSSVCHIISRGNNREWVFKEREDFEKYLAICRRYKERFGFNLFHWVLMSNHVHLVMETTKESSLSKVMQGMNLAYTIWFNRKNLKVEEDYPLYGRKFLSSSPKLYRVRIDGKIEAKKNKGKEPYGKGATSKADSVFKEGLFERVY